MGGGAAAHRLSSAGLDILLLEMGRSDVAGSASFAAAASEDDADARLEAGRWPNRLDVTIDQVTNLTWPVLGCGIGGSTLFYSAALERMHRDDLDSNDTSPSGISLNWPISYDELQPYYLEIERLLEVRGSQDPLDTDSQYALLEPPPLSECDRHFYDWMERSGLGPYRLHVGIRYQPGCTECGGQVCPIGCKSDARNRLIEPALKSGKLTILDRTTVTRLVTDSSRVDHVIAQRDGEAVSFRAKAFVLCAGALNTPKLLLKSTSDRWPNGIGNCHDVVGRYLMFHAYDFIAIWPKNSRLSRIGPLRTLASRKLYRVNDTRLGYFHSTGLTAGYGEILHYLHQHYASGTHLLHRLVRAGLRLPAWLAAKLFRDASVFSTLIEDFPSTDNRVMLSENSPSEIAFHYAIPNELRERTKLLRELVRRHFRDHRVIVINRDVHLNLGHPCGTCRAGHDPRSSVVDASCRIHGIDNAYIADGSVFPTSGGVNPSLTIGALALRAADQLVMRVTGII